MIVVLIERRERAKGSLPKMNSPIVGKKIAKRAGTKQCPFFIMSGRPL